MLGNDDGAAETTREFSGRRAVRAGRVRLCATAIVVACGSVLGLAIKVRPDPRDFGTHEQIGGGPCGMLVVTGLPCPTCGMTTAFAHTVRGQWLRAFWAQPAGFVLALATAAACGTAMAVMITGRTLRHPVTFLSPYRLLVGLLVLLLFGWGWKLATGLLDGTLPVAR